MLAHGAGAGQKSPFMARFARGMAQRDITTATFDFPYMTAGRKVPDRAPVLGDFQFGVLVTAARVSNRGKHERQRPAVDPGCDITEIDRPGLQKCAHHA